MKDCRDSMYQSTTRLNELFEKRVQELGELRSELSQGLTSQLGQFGIRLKENESGFQTWQSEFEKKSYAILSEVSNALKLTRAD